MAFASLVSRGLIALTVLGAAPWAAAQALVATGSNMSFVTRQMGVGVEGSFKRFDAQVQFDPKRADAARVGFAVDLTSVDIGDANTMAELRKPGWFDSARVPQARFASTGVKALGGNRFEISGTLDIKGISRPVVVPITLVQTGMPAGQTRAEGQFALRRLDWRIGDGDWNDPSLVANEVQVRLRLVFTGIAPL